MLRSFSVFHGDVANCACEVVVNSSNTRLALGTGISGRLAELCGDGYQEYLRESRPDEFSAGDAVLTGPGTGPWKAVVHAAAVDYENPVREGPPEYSCTSPRVVERATISALRAAEGYKSIGIPLMGSTGPKLRVSESIRAICVGIRRYFPTYVREHGVQSSYRDVHIVVFNKEELSRVEAELLSCQLIRR